MHTARRRRRGREWEGEDRKEKIGRREGGKEGGKRGGSYVTMYKQQLMTLTNVSGLRVPHNLCRVVGCAIMKSDQLAGHCGRCTVRR